MAEAARNDVLDRKISAGQRVQDAQAMSPAKALRRAIARSADEQWALPILASGVEEVRLDQEDAIDALPATGQMIVMIDGPTGELGIALIDRQVVRALVEIQTISCVTSSDPGERAFTPTDAALVQPFVDDVFARFATNLGPHPAAALVLGFRFGAMVGDRRTVANQMSAANYRSFQVDLDISIGARQGQLRLLLPEPVEAPAAPDEAPREPEAEDQMMLVPAQLDVRLAAVPISIAAAQALRPGDLLRLGPQALNEADLMAGEAFRVSTGTLGQMNGQRALRLHLPAGRETSDMLESEFSLAPGGALGPPLGDALTVPDAPTLELPSIPDDEPGALLTDEELGALANLDPEEGATDMAEPEMAPLALDDLPDLPPLDFDG
jgi:flagellar motor switch protein FliM